MMEIQLNNVKKAYSSPLIDLESFTFETGKIHGIIGHNGIGKTTLLRILAGLEPVDSGCVTYGGKLYSTSVAKQLSYVYQKPYMLNKSVFENIAFPLKLRKYP